MPEEISKEKTEKSKRGEKEKSKGEKEKKVKKEKTSNKSKSESGKKIKSASEKKTKSSIEKKVKKNKADGESKIKDIKDSLFVKKKSKEKGHEAKTASNDSESSNSKDTKVHVGENIHDAYEIGEELGRGAFSVVKMATYKSDGTKWAIKMVDKRAGQDMERLQTEIEILKNVDHPNIISLKAIYITQKIFYIVTELVTGGELFDKIVQVGNYTENSASILVEKILSAIGFLHNMGIVHRDLKPENLLLKSTKDISDIKLADFGLSKILGQKVMMQTACGTPGYVAPEVLQAHGYGPEVDLWSIGVITYILLCGFPPFYREELPELFEQIMSAAFDFPPEYWDTVSSEAKDFIKKLLVVKPTDRMNVEQSLQHPWIAKRGVSKGKIKTSFKDKMREYTNTRKRQSTCTLTDSS